MRDVIVFSLFIAVLPLCFLRPWVGLCTFTWLAYNRTQDLTWGFARTLPLSQLIAIFMLLGWLIVEFRPVKLRGPYTKAMIALLIWIGISMLVTGLDWGLQGRRYTEFSKVVLISLITGSLTINRTRLKTIMAVIACALGFYGFKNGLLLMTGSRSIAGPGGMLKDNNDFALAMIMVVPMLYYLADEMRDLPYGFYIRRFMKAAFVLTFLAVVSTGSRGGFLSLSVAVFLMAMKTRYKLPALGLIAVLGVVGFVATPADYRERILTIFSSSEEQDDSVQGRFVSWRVAGNMIEANPVFGIGMNQTIKQYNDYTQDIVNKQGSNQHYARVTHNSYLQIWAESGTPAYLLFMFICVGSIVSLELMWRRYRRKGDLWVLPYCHAIQVSLCSYVIGATFLNRSQFDLVYQLVVVVSVIPVVVANERQVRAAHERRLGPRVANEVEIDHRDSFVKVGRA